MRNDNIDLGELVNMIGVELRIAQILADKAFNISQKAEIPSGHFTILALIDLNPGINQSMLAKCMYLDRSTMVPILDQLELKKWIQRRKKPGDRRSYALNLTAQGKKVLKKTGASVQALEGDITAKMGPEKRHKLLALTKEFQHALLALIDEDN
jgi:DNA-binding MarR family transcriptional regulator